MQKIFENNEFIIINKDSGQSAHNDEQSIVSSFLPEQVFLVNRLDRETSGLVLLAKKANLVAALQIAMQEAEKIYLAVLRGNLPVNLNPSVWDYPISDKAEGFANPAGKTEDQKQSVSKYRVLESNPYFSLVEVQIVTGRQHQIRKHSAIFKKPIVGDMRYANKKDNISLFKRYNFERMMLHCSRMKFSYQNHNFEFKAETPKEFSLLMNAISTAPTIISPVSKKP